MDSIYLILAAPVVGTIGQLFLKLGMRQVGEITLSELKNNNIQVILSMISNAWILIAIPIYVGGFVLWLIILSKFKLSFAYPFLALSFIMVPLVSSLILGEYVSILRWAGSFVIFSGIVLIGFSN